MASGTQDWRAAVDVHIVEQVLRRMRMTMDWGKIHGLLHEPTIQAGDLYYPIDIVGSGIILGGFATWPYDSNYPNDYIYVVVDGNGIMSMNMQTLSGRAVNSIYMAPAVLKEITSDNYYVVAFSPFLSFSSEIKYGVKPDPLGSDKQVIMHVYYALYSITE